MTRDVVAVARTEPCRVAAERMVDDDVLGAVVEQERGESSPGIVTARDVLELVAEREDPRTTRVADRFTPEATAAAPGWSLERAAEAMLEGGFRHLVVVDGGETAGVVSIRDIVRAWIRERVWRRTIQIREATTTEFIALRGDEPVQEAAGRMAREPIGAAIVERRRGPPGIFTERDVLAAVAAADDVRAERVDRHLSRRLTYSAPDWSLKQAAEAMIKGGFQHVVVVDRDGTVGLISMRDILRRWLD